MIRADKLKSLFLIALLAIMASPVAWAQRSTGQNAGQSAAASAENKGTADPVVPTTVPPLVPESGPTPPGIEETQARMRNTDRQKQLVLESQKLLTLATELKVEVDKSTKETMSLDVIRKADEIEKLAHSVKEKMKGN